MAIRVAKTCLLALSLLGIAGTANRLPGHNAPPHEMVTRMPGEQPRHWRSMHTVWKVLPGSGDTEDRMQDMALQGDRLYYRCPSEAGCIQTATGRYLWKHSFYALPPPDQPQPHIYDHWHIVIGDRFVYTVEDRYSGNTMPPEFHLYALQRNNGHLAWTYVLKQNPLGAPCPAGDRVLTPLSDGTVLALNSATGHLLWRKPIAIAGSQSENAVLQVAGGNLVAQIGSGRIAAFRLRDGKQIWSYPDTGTHSDHGSSEGFSIDHGVVYALLSDNELVALNLSNGQRLWSRHTNGGGSPSSAVFMLGESLLSNPFGEPGAVQKRNGQSITHIADPHKYEYVRKEPFVMPWPSEAAQGRKPKPQLFETIDGMQLVNGVPRNLRSVSISETLVMLDAATGAEQWRWQPEDGVFLEKILSDGHRIYLQDYDSIRAVEAGPTPELPTAPDKRRELVRFLVQAAFHEFGIINKKGSWVYIEGASPSAQQAPDSAEAKLNLVKLGADSVPAVMEEVRREVTGQDKNLPDPKELSYAISNSLDGLSGAIDLLTDIGDRSCVPGLMEELSAAKNPISRMIIARALIRLNDSRALPTLMQYARTSPNDPNTRQDALFEIAGSTRDTTFRNEFTRYLQTILNDATVPASLRLFARFELLNDRGAEAREVAHAAFKGGKPVRLSLEGVTLTSENQLNSLGSKVQEGFPTQVYMMSTAKDISGKIWGVFYSDYLGYGEDLWFAQSTDGTHWMHPMFAMNLDSRCSPSGTPGHVQISCMGGVMVLSWEEHDERDRSAKPLVHVDRLTIADIERDSEGDGLNDLLKREIGLDLHRRDTNAKAVPDIEDKNAAVRREPETNEAGIFQAVVEALCQVGRDGDPDTKPKQFGGSKAPLVLLTPPGSHGVSILGHPGPVVFRRITGHQRFPGSLYSAAGYRFTAPHIDLKGKYHSSIERQLALNAQRQDPYTKLNQTMARETQASFHDYFPYEISADGTRARVGWEQRLGGGMMDRSEIGFDIEARNIAGRWYSVECRCIFADGRHWHEEAVIPDTRLSAVSR